MDIWPSASFKLRGHEGKYIFKKALEPYLPDDIFTVTRWGFRYRWQAGFAARCAKELNDALMGPVLADTGFFNRTVV